jgi:hypothetical protein
MSRDGKRAARLEARERTESVVARVEGEVIQRRRSERGLDADAPLAGLALSGEGTAGAAFSLGVACALSEQRVFRRFDYLSSVSGGALAAACIIWFSRLRSKQQPSDENGPLVPPRALRYIREHAHITGAAHFWNRRNQRRSHLERERGLGVAVVRSTAIALFVHGSLLVGSFFVLNRLDAIVGLSKPLFRLVSVRPPWSSIVNGLNFGLLAGALLLLLALLSSVFGAAPRLFWGAWQQSAGRAQRVEWARARCGAVWLLLMLLVGLLMTGILFGRSGWGARIAWLVPLAVLSAFAFVRWHRLWSTGGPLWPRFARHRAKALRRLRSWLEGRWRAWSMRLDGPLARRVRAWRAARARATEPRSPEPSVPRRGYAVVALLLGLLPTLILLGLTGYYVFVSGARLPATPARLDRAAGLLLTGFTLVYVALLLPRAWRRLAAFCSALLSGAGRAQRVRAKRGAARREQRLARVLGYSGLGFVFGSVPPLSRQLAWLFPRPELRLAALALFVLIGVLFVVQAAPPPIGRMPGKFNRALSAWAALSGGIVLMYGVLLLAYGCVSAALGSSAPWLVFVLPLVGAVAGMLHDINQASPGAAYRQRLTDAFLPDDQALRHGHWQPALSALSFPLTRAARSNQVPYPLFNAAVHITRSNDARLQRRGADNFVLSPLFCGSSATRYVNTRHWARGELSLSDALGICTAAVSPLAAGAAARTLRQRLFARALSLLNLRLSYWADNPRFCSRQRARGRSSRPNFLRPLLAQLFGRGLSERQKHVELADGAHFEALGLYELVRRRVQLIVVVDATRDPAVEFVELKRSLRLIRAELGVAIDVPLEAGREPLAASIGSIHYPGQAHPCPLVYFKAPARALPERHHPQDGAAPPRAERSPSRPLEEPEFQEQYDAGYRAGTSAQALLERLATETPGRAS